MIRIKTTSYFSNFVHIRIQPSKIASLTSRRQVGQVRVNIVIIDPGRHSEFRLQNIRVGPRINRLFPASTGLLCCTTRSRPWCVAGWWRTCGTSASATSCTSPRVATGSFIHRHKTLNYKNEIIFNLHTNYLYHDRLNFKLKQKHLEIFVFRFILRYPEGALCLLCGALEG